RQERMPALLALLRLLTLPARQARIVMMTKRKWLAIVLAVLLLGLGTAFFLWPRDRITAESWEKIRLGMTEKEVEDILGGPGTNIKDIEEFERTRGVPLIKVEIQLLEGLGRRITEAAKVWIGRSGVIMIEFDKSDVTNKHFWEVKPNSFLDRVSAWFGQ